MELKFIIEAILFAAQKPLSAAEISELFAAAAVDTEDPAVKGLKKVKPAEINTHLDQLQREHQEGQRSFRLVCVAGAWQFVSQPEYGPWLKALYGKKSRPPRLSQPALETLAIIAYRQRLTRAEIEQIRGVAVDGVLQTLLERGLVEQAGRAEVIGRPMNYATTQAFLEYFGLRDLDELPAADELRRIEIKKPETLLTAEPGLATAPPEQLKSEETPAEQNADTATAEASPESTATPAPAETLEPAESVPPPEDEFQGEK